MTRMLGLIPKTFPFVPERGFFDRFLKAGIIRHFSMRKGPGCLLSIFPKMKKNIS